MRRSPPAIRKVATTKPSNGHDEPPAPVDPLIAELTDLLRPPRGKRLPALPELTAPDAARIPDRLVADVLDDALAHLRVRWD